MSKLQKILLTALSVAGAALVTWMLESNRIPLYDMFTTEEKADFEFADVYGRILNKGWHTQSKDVIVVPTDSVKYQEDLIALIPRLDSLQAAAIGVDFIIPNISNDSVYVNTVKKCKNVVMPCILGYNEKSKDYYVNDSTMYCTLGDDVTMGAVNLDAGKLGDKVRRFRQEFNIHGNIAIPSFPSALVKVASPDKYIEFVSRQNDTHDGAGELIKYGGVDIRIVYPGEFLTSDSIPSIDWNSHIVRDTVFKDAVVLLGGIEGREDTHSTPLGEKPGVIIHAYTVNTIMTSSYVTDINSWVNWIVAVLMSTIFVWLVLYFRSRFRHTGRMTVRIIQMAFIAIFFITGSALFTKNSLYINFSITILMIGLSVAVLDFMTGICWIIQHLWKKFRPGKAAVCAALAVVCSIGCVSAQQKGEFRVDNTPKPKNVSVIKGKTLTPVKPGDEFNMKDKLLFDSKTSEIKLIKKSNGRAFPWWGREGEITVGEIVRRINSGIKPTPNPNSEPKKPSNKIGVTTMQIPKRGQQMSSITTLEDEFAAFILDYIANDTGEVAVCGLQDAPLDLKSEYVCEANEFKMSMANRDTVGYYVNVICVNRTTKQIGVCYNVDFLYDNDIVKDLSMWVDAKTEASFPDLGFVYNDDCDFYLIASTKEFSWGLLQKILNDKDARRVPYDATQFHMCRKCSFGLG